MLCGKKMVKTEMAIIHQLYQIYFLPLFRNSFSVIVRIEAARQ